MRFHYFSQNLCKCCISFSKSSLVILSRGEHLGVAVTVLTGLGAASLSASPALIAARAPVAMASSASLRSPTYFIARLPASMKSIRGDGH